MGKLIKVNPKTQMMAGNGVGMIAGPALIYVGVFHSPNLKQKALFGGLGALLMYSSYAGMKAGFKGD
jgi:hypothetical protein